MAKLIAAIAANTIDIAHAENVARRVVACGLHRSCELALITMSPRLRLHPASDGAPAALALCWINLTPGHVKTFPFYRYGMAAIPHSYGCCWLRVTPALPWRRSRDLARCSRDTVHNSARRATAGSPRLTA